MPYNVCDQMLTYIYPTAREAQAAGETFYFDEYEPCERGHISKRYASNYRCYVCQRTSVLRAQGGVLAESKADMIEFQEYLDTEQYISTRCKPTMLPSTRRYFEGKGPW